MSDTLRSRAACFDDRDELFDAVLAHYTCALKQTSAALEWLVAHGITGTEAIDTFGVGLADRTLGRLLPEGSVGEGVRSRLKEIGVLRSSGHECFRGCVVLPVRDAAGRITQCCGRRLQRVGNVTDAAPDEAVWLPAPAAGIWHPQALVSAEVIVAQSVLDGLAWWSAGYRHVLAPGGPAGFPEDIAALLAKAGVTRVLLAQARTDDGERTAAALTEKLATEKVECYRVVFARGADASKHTAESPDRTADLAERLRAAIWLGNGSRTSRRRALIEPGSSVGQPAATKAAEASPVPPAVVSQGEIQVDGGELRLTTSTLAWRVRGLDRIAGTHSLRVTASVRHLGTGASHLDVVDLFSARARNQFLAETATELKLGGVEEVRRDVGRLLLACEDRVLDLQHQAQRSGEPAPAMTATEEAAAMQFLRDSQLLDRITEDIAALGVVGERDNALLLYLAAVSRLLNTPLAIVLQSGSGTGKTTLADAVLSLIPAEARVSVSALTSQSLFYLSETALAHKVLSVAEAQGAQRASYALKVLTGDGELSIASTGRDSVSGALVARTYRVHGPVALVLTTTAPTLDDELTNRAVVIGVSDEQTHTDQVLAAQRQAQTLDGVIARHGRQAIRDLHANVQRLLEPIEVVIPDAPLLNFPDRRSRARRDQAKLLTLIRTVALLHQHQRPRKRISRRGIELHYIEATPADVAVAQRLASACSGRPDLAELSPQTRQLLHLLDEFAAVRACGHERRRDDVRFTRREAREYTGWSDYATRRHLARLVDLEYACTHRAGNAFTYELLWSERGAEDRAEVSRPPRGDLAAPPRPRGGG